MDILVEKFRKKLNYVSVDFIRNAMDEVPWNHRLTGIKGARGTGKTTLVLQYIKMNYPNSEDVLYVSLDDIWFTANTLSDLTSRFVKFGGKYLFLDEVHKYPTWAQELKNIYDDYPDLHIVFTGSSLLEILNARADLSRRAIVYRMQGLSFREYLQLETGISFKAYDLEDILKNHIQITDDILNKLHPLKYFLAYLKCGYYPYFLESKDLYLIRLAEVISMILEIELPLLRGVDISYTSKIKQLLMIIAESSPFIPNISKLSERMGLNRNTLISYLHYLHEAELSVNIYKNVKGITRLQKPDKVLIENPNLAYALASHRPDIGSLRETFFVNQLAYKNLVEYAEKGDFVLNEHYLFEVGGSAKSETQLKDWDPDKRYVVADDIEYGMANKIPLWLMGFLY